MGSAGEIDVLPSILVDVSIGNAAIPLPVIDVPETGGDIPKPEFPLIEINPGGYLVGSKNEIL